MYWQGKAVAVIQHKWVSLFVFNVLDVRVLARLSWESCKIIPYISTTYTKSQNLHTDIHTNTHSQIHKATRPLSGSFSHHILEPFKLSLDCRCHISITFVWWQCSWNTKESANEQLNYLCMLYFATNESSYVRMTFTCSRSST